MIEYIRISQKDLPRVEPLWNALIQHLYQKTNHFKQEFQNKVFLERFESFLMNKEDDCFILIARDTDKARDIGYIAVHVSEKKGEVDSLYLMEDYQFQGIGSVLMENALDFFTGRGIKDQFLYVSEGNEDTIKFYQKFGFILRKYYMTRVDDSRY